MVSYYHMESDALVWFQDTLGTSQFTSRETFIRVLLVRFGPIAYDNPMEALTYLKQTSIVLTYNSQFECLCNSLRELFDHHKISCFLSGLKDEINLPICMLNPINLGVAFELAKIQEEYLLSAKKSETSFKQIFLTKPTHLTKPIPHSGLHLSKPAKETTRITP